MVAYIVRRILLAIVTLFAISVLSFIIIQLPPGDYITSYIAQMASMGSVVSDEEAQTLRIQYGLGEPMYVQYLKWMKQIIRGNFGMSMEWRRPVTEVIGERLWLTVAVSVSAITTSQTDRSSSAAGTALTARDRWRPIIPPICEPQL